eukprot:COSAG02_NODE_51096_length_316_cov_0.907834_1_plen_51_part_10
MCVCVCACVCSFEIGIHRDQNATLMDIRADPSDCCPAASELGRTPCSGVGA